MAIMKLKSEDEWEKSKSFIQQQQKNTSEPEMIYFILNQQQNAFFHDESYHKK